MNIIENRKLSKLLDKTIGVDIESGIILIADKNNTTTDITNDILEMVTIAIEDKQIFVGLNRMIEISVTDITTKDYLDGNNG